MKVLYLVIIDHSFKSIYLDTNLITFSLTLKLDD